MTWGLIKYGKTPEEVESETEQLAGLDIEGGKEVSYFVQRLSDDYQEEDESEKPVSKSANPSVDEEDENTGNLTKD